MDKQEPKKEEKATVAKQPETAEKQDAPALPQKVIGVIADEVAKTLIQRLPGLIPKPNPKKKKKEKKKVNKKQEYGMYLDTSAIIDGRIFDVINLGLFRDVFVIPESILLELKQLADSQDAVKRERGRKGLEYLEKLKKSKKARIMVLEEKIDLNKEGKVSNVDELLIKAAKDNKGRIITCDYNLEKKATISNIPTINMNALANCLKVTAVPGESLHIKVLHQGKDPTQGVGYLDDGTMIVVESGRADVGKEADVVVSRIIQTASGRILFAKKI